MKMPSNAFLTAIRAGQKQIGLWCSLASNDVTEVVAGAGYDWLLVDMVHFPGDVLTILGLIGPPIRPTTKENQ